MELNRPVSSDSLSEVVILLFDLFSPIKILNSNISWSLQQRLLPPAFIPDLLYSLCKYKVQQEHEAWQTCFSVPRFGRSILSNHRKVGSQFQFTESRPALCNRIYLRIARCWIPSEVIFPQPTVPVLVQKTGNRDSTIPQDMDHVTYAQTQPTGSNYFCRENPCSLCLVKVCLLKKSDYLFSASALTLSS